MEKKTQKGYITINVSIDTWNELKARKRRPSHTFDEIIREALFEIPEVEVEEDGRL